MNGASPETAIESNDSGGLLRHVSFRSATFLVVANMVGAGIFTTTGFQAADIGHPGYIFALWIVGGALAFCGALCYAELGAAMPAAGGEYVYLRQTYGEAFGFMSAFVSLIAGFSAPIASASKGFAIYATSLFPGLAERAAAAGVARLDDAIAIAVVWALVAVQLRGARTGIRFMDAITGLKIAGIVGLILAAAIVGDGSVANFSSVSAAHLDQSSAERQAALGTSLIFVMFCYSGWNASAYLAGEFERPQRDLPASLLLGTAAVVALYLGLNAVYFYGAPASELAGKVEVGLVSARQLFGETGVSLTIALLLVSLLASASAMTMAGPRVYYAVGRDFSSLRMLARTDAVNGTPRVALWVQGGVATVIIVLGRIDQIMQYAGFTLTLFASLAVSCVVVLRITAPELPRPFRAWGYPGTPVLFIAVSVWMMFWSARGRPVESALAFATVVSAWISFAIVRRLRGGPDE